MWLITSFGFFSVVQKTGEQGLTVRARVAEDLQRLRERYMPELSETTTGAGTDYPHRARIDREAFAGGLRRVVADLTYPNFKSEVARAQGQQRAHLYSGVWTTLRKLEQP